MQRAGLLAVLIAVPVAAKPVPRAIPASDLMIRQSSPEIDWRWRAAPEAATQPGLLAALRRDALNEAGRARTVARADAAGARTAGFPFRKHESITDWTLAADTPHLLALAGQVYSFTGGAHGNTGYAARIWDKAAKRAIPIDALFTDWPRARRLIEPAFCRAVAEEQKQRRAGATLGGDFDACPKLSEQPIVPWGGLGTRAPEFRVLVGPYVAGPYSEGSYLITVTWPEAVRSVVKPAYRDDLFGRPE